MMISMSSAFSKHQLLNCSTIEQCMILNADVRKGRLVKCGHLQTGGGRKRGPFADVLYERPLISQVIKHCIITTMPQRGLRGHHPVLPQLTFLATVVYINDLL